MDTDLLELASSSSLPDDDEDNAGRAGGDGLMDTEITVVLSNDDHTAMNINNSCTNY